MIKSKLKPTEIGHIPEDWELRALNEVAYVTSGKRLPLGSSLTDNVTLHPYIRVTDMRPGTVSVRELKFVPAHVAESIKRYRIFEEDIFISVAGTLGLVGKIPVSINGANLTENANRITNISCCRDFLLHVLMSQIIQNRIKNMQTVGAQPKLALSRIRKFAIPLPPTPAEQQAIARALSDVDALIESLERLIAKKRAIKQGAMQQLLTGKKRLPGGGDKWVIRRLGDLADMQSGGTPSTSVSEYYGGTIPWVSISDMTMSGKVILETEKTITKLGLQNSTAKLFAKGVVLYAMYASLGECSISGTDLSTSQAILGIETKNMLDCEFLYYYLSLRKNTIRRLGQQGTQANLNKGMVQDFVIALPLLEEQKAIAKFLSDMDCDIWGVEKRLEKTRLIKQAMMQELLTGKTRLLPAEVAHV